ncbi:MAG: c-type cytochrome, partial [Opitutaceae bacterium]
LWAGRALEEKNPQAAIEALIALARVGERDRQAELLAALKRFELAALPEELRLPYLRAWQLAFTRMGRPGLEVRAKLAARFDAHFPSEDPFITRELLALLVYLDSPTVVRKAVPLLSVAEPIGDEAESIGGETLIARNDAYARAIRRVTEHRPDRQQIAVAYALRVAEKGWTPELRRKYFGWFQRAHTWKGGASFSGFIVNIRNDALGLVTDVNQRTKLAALSEPPATTFESAGVTPKGPGRNYTVDDALAVVGGDPLSGRDFTRGRAMFAATGCIACHQFNGEGSGIGPDLTGAGARYSVRDLLENIVEPSKVISDQYGSELIELDDGETLVGRVVDEENGSLSVMNNPFQPDQLATAPAADVKSRSPYPISMMPPGLINALNEDELRDLLAYLLSGGNAEDAMFSKAQ